jgi:hypothetical protein
MASAYIETTIPSYYVARPSKVVVQAARQTNTRRWWDDGCSHFTLFTSLETMDEILRGDSAAAEAREELMRSIPLLSITDDVAKLTKALLAKILCPRKRVRTRFTLQLQQSTKWTFLSLGILSISPIPTFGRSCGGKWLLSA